MTETYAAELMAEIHRIEDKLHDLGSEYDEAKDGSLRETEIEDEINDLESQWKELNDRIDMLADEE